MTEPEPIQFGRVTAVDQIVFSLSADSEVPFGSRVALCSGGTLTPAAETPIGVVYRYEGPKPPHAHVTPPPTPHPCAPSGTLCMLRWAPDFETFIEKMLAEIQRQAELDEHRELFVAFLRSHLAPREPDPFEPQAALGTDDALLAVQQILRSALALSREDETEWVEGMHAACERAAEITQTAIITRRLRARHATPRKKTS